MKYDYIASIELNAENLSLDEVAERLSNIFNGFVFKEDLNDRFDEVPAYIAALNEIELILLGPPEDEDADYYLVKLYCRKEIDLEQYRHYGCSFLESLPAEGFKVERSGYVDVSLQLADFINKATNEFQCGLLD